MRIWKTVLLMTIGLTVRAQGQSDDSEIRTILNKVQQNYSTSRAWHFEHRISVTEQEGAASPVPLSDATLVTANRAASAAGVVPSAFCAEMCRIETGTARGRSVLVKDGSDVWFLDESANQFMKGKTLRDVSMSVPGAMTLSMHVMPLAFDEQQWKDFRLVGEEPIQVNGARRDTYVIEATLKSNGGLTLEAMEARTLSEPDPALFSSAAGIYQLMQIQGLGYLTGPNAYFAKLGQTARARLWIDKETYLIVKRITDQQVAKLTAPTNPQQPTQMPTPIEVSLTVVDMFSHAVVGDAVESSVFTFRPPADSKEVPNIRQR